MSSESNNLEEKNYTDFAAKTLVNELVETLISGDIIMASSAIRYSLKSKGVHLLLSEESRQKVVSVGKRTIMPETFGDCLELLDYLGDDTGVAELIDYAGNTHDYRFLWECDRISHRGRVETPEQQRWREMKKEARQLFVSVLSEMDQRKNNLPESWRDSPEGIEHSEERKAVAEAIIYIAGSETKDWIRRFG